MLFGIWGMIAFLWFSVAGINVLYCNYRYGDASLRTANTFLLATFVVRFLLFMTVSGTGLHAAGGFSPRLETKMLIIELWGLGDLSSPRHFCAPRRNGLTSRCWPSPSRSICSPGSGRGESVAFTAPWTAFKHKYQLWRWPLAGNDPFAPEAGGGTV
jgi:hypothetical protein